MSHELTVTRNAAGQPVSLGCDGRPLYQRLPGALLECVIEDERAAQAASPLQLSVVEQTPQRVVIAASFTLPAEALSGNDPTRAGFRCDLFPAPMLGTTRAHLPKSVYGPQFHAALRQLGAAPDPEVDMLLGCPGQNSGGISAHYLEPIGSSGEMTTEHPLLLPVAGWYQPDVQPTLGLLAEPDRPWSLACIGGRRTAPHWTCMTRIAPTGQDVTLRCWLVASTEGAAALYDAFHQHAHHDPIAPPDWLREARFHYFDFLAPRVEGGPRGEGFEQSIEHFDTFSVDLATTHGYYAWWGDYIHPDRPEWTAMKGDLAGAVPMSLSKLRTRRDATRQAGSRFGVYLHLAGFDRASPLWDTLHDSVRHVEPGQAKHYPWDGPDMEGEAAFMSIASDDWANHLLQQAQWIMELLDPDAIVVDETFAGIGYDHHPDHPGLCSAKMIPFMKKLRRIIKSFGDDRALLTSDCGMAPFALWADGEGGDCAYANLLGAPAFRRAVGGFASVLHHKPWLPCAWQANMFWDDQMDLARRCGTGVGIGHGWIEYTGLAGLPPRRRQRILDDLKILRAHSRTKVATP